MGSKYFQTACHFQELPLPPSCCAGASTLQFNHEFSAKHAGDPLPWLRGACLLHGCQNHTGCRAKEPGATLAHILALGVAPREPWGAVASSVTSRGLTSSHSEAKEGDFSSLFFPMLQLDKDSLRLPIASSVGEQVRRSESDLDKLRLSLSSALGLLVGGTRLPAPLRSPSASAPPGCGDAV